MSWVGTLLKFPSLRERPCWRCGYSLRGLPAEVRNCPECGLAVRMTLSADPSLTCADPAWLNRLSGVSFALSLGIVLTIGSFILWWYILRLQDVSAWAGGVGPTTFLLTVVVVAAWWVMATPPPYSRFETPSRIAIMIRAVMSVFLVGVAALLFGVPRDLNATLPFGHGVDLALGIMWIYVLAIFHTVLLAHALRILRRSGKRWLRETAATFLLASVISLLVIVVAPCWGPEITMAIGRRGLTYAMWLPVIGCLLASCWWLILGIQFRQFRDDAKTLWVSD